MPTARINGAALSYEIFGGGPPVVFVHGFLARSTGDYYEAFLKLMTSSYRLHCIDMRCHGASATADDNATLDQSARDITAFIDFLALDDVLLVGHSMGGYLSLAAAIHDPRRLKALAVITPAGSVGEARTDQDVADFMAARSDPEAMNERFAAMFVKKPAPAALDTLRASALCVPDQVAKRWISHEWPNSNQTDKLSSIDLPVLSLIGANDIVVPPQRQYDDVRLLPNAKAIVFTDEGHMLPLENPQRCVSEISRFIEDIS